MEGLPHESKAQEQPFRELWRNFPMELKKNFSSGLHTSKDFLVGQNHHQNSQARYIFPNGLHTIKDFLVGQNYQEGSPASHQYTPQQVILHNRSFTKDFLVSQNTKATYAHILQELNMQA